MVNLGENIINCSINHQTITHLTDLGKNGILFMILTKYRIALTKVTRVQINLLDLKH